MNPSAPSPPPPPPHLPPPPDLSTTLSSLTNLLSLCNHTLPFSPPPPNLTTNLIPCPFNHHHLVPPSSLFLHHLRCPSSPRPIPGLPDLLHSLTYPKTLHTPPQHSLSLDPYFDFASNFFYRHSPGVVSFSPADSISKTLTLPSVLSLECANSADTQINDNLNSDSVRFRILPSEYCAVKRELESWTDFPVSYSGFVLRAILGLGIVAKDRDLMTWIIANSPRYGVVIDAPMQRHIFLLFCLCFKAILREALVSSTEKRNSDCAGLRYECPVLNEALAWLQSQVSILYANGKFFVLEFVKNCVLVGASGLLLFPLEGKVAAEGCDSVKESKDLGANFGGIEDSKAEDSEADDGDEEKAKCILNMKIFGSQVAAAVAALHERALLECRIRGIWFSQQPTKHQQAAEHGYLSERASEERKKRLDYRPLIDHDGLLLQQSANQDASRGDKTREELLAEERDFKRRRMSYRGKKIKPSPTQVMRDMVEQFMEGIKLAGGVELDVKVSKENEMLPSKPPSGHDIPVEANNSRKTNYDSPAVTNSNSSYHEQQSHTSDKTKPEEDMLSRDYEQHRQGHYRSHDYVEDKRSTGRVKYHIDRASTSPERHRSHSRSHEQRIHHQKQDYSSRKKYDHLSRTRDRWQKDTDRNHVSDYFMKNAFSDRYDPAESLDTCEDDISSNAKYSKPDKFYDKELH